MNRTFKYVLLSAVVIAQSVHAQQTRAFKPVTTQMLVNPSPNDWLMYSRTYDAQRFSPLKQITKDNVAGLKEVFKKEFAAGNQESIPIVYDGVMYVMLPGATVQALDATNGSVLWEHKRPSGATRAKALAIYDDMVFYTAPDTPDNTIVALDARTGAVRWETKSSGNLTSGAIVVEGKVLSGRTCRERRTTRRPARKRGASIPRRVTTTRGALRGQARRWPAGWRPRGVWPAGTTRSAG